jgi:crotonobetainyl-CoA:carnitine CoA-transferase CaiB-like acyl-CoA transferase
MIGEHGPEILKELGYDEAAIETLLNDKIISVEKLKTK